MILHARENVWRVYFHFRIGAQHNYDPLALAVLVIGIGIIELLALII